MSSQLTNLLHGLMARTRPTEWNGLTHGEQLHQHERRKAEELRRQRDHQLAWRPR
ncbi:hypothetical protein [Jannaschia sp. W003]|uniref:hypothetical protein n=1 Tax=Jannaschia sp. W003 TaxID=2867012 RepID=UPI0021A3BE54|nr:hypothetical protein [Jannaschia sp. W003]UWQ22292.1 hypothetical protein K3554_04465 [Jannaschia sp. W003]